jgi:hypothetical protein
MSAISAPSPRATWRSVAVPTEHGGWGLTLEPVLLGMLVAPSAAGLALGGAAFLAFVARVPLKIVLVDRYRHRRLERTRIAARLAAAELTLLAVLVTVAVVLAGAAWMIPLAPAAVLFGIELWFDRRSRSRRLLPELCGAVGIAAVASAIVVADNGSALLAIGLWLILAARAVASVAFAHTQVHRLRDGAWSTRTSDLAQLGGLVIALIAALVEPLVGWGALCVVAVVAVQFGWSRGPARSAKVVGLWQMVFGLAVVAMTALGVLT